MHNTKSPIPKKQEEKKAKANAFTAFGVITLNKAKNQKRDTAQYVAKKRSERNTFTHLMADTNMQKGAQILTLTHTTHEYR